MNHKLSDGGITLRVVAAPDSYKGSLSAKEAAEAIMRGIKRADSMADVMLKPIADGGEGTVDTILEALPGAEKIIQPAAGPLGVQTNAAYALLPGGTAVLELAAASGLTLVREGDRRPLEATSFGTGELMRDALNRGCRRIIMGLGGSATSDAGMGLLQALGCRFLDAAGQELGRGGGELHRLAVIDRSGLDARLSDTEIIVCCDVTNPLYGPEGAATVYGPQKGANAAQVELLDKGLRHFARIVAADIGSDISRLPGGGAAGGAGAGMAAMLGAVLEPGFGVLAGITELEQAIAGADLVVTGEGNTDSQTLNGKVPVGVAGLARRYGVPVIVISGGIGAGARELYAAGVTAFFSIVNRSMTLAQAMEQATELVEEAAENAVRVFQAAAGRASD